MVQKIRPYFEKAIGPLCLALVRLRVNPNWITVFGLLIMLCCAYAFAVQKLYWAALIGFFGAIFDVVDGKVARDTGAVTKFGSVFDSNLDRFSEIACTLGILYSFKGMDVFPVASFIIYIAITGALMTSYVRARAQGAGCDTKKGLLQRGDRGIVMLVCAIIGHQALLWGMGFIAVFSYVTVVQRLVIVWSNTKNS